MKNVRESISDYDKAMQVAIEIIERQLNKLSVHEESNEESSEEESSASEEESSEGDSSEEMTVAHSSITSKVGDEVVKFFPSYGRFKGRVSRINGDDEDGKFIRIIFEDGEEVDYSQQEVDEFTALSAIPVGEVGFQFIKKFGAAGYFSGSVIEKKSSGKLLCRFNDGAEHEYTHKQIETFACEQVEGTIESDATESDDSSDESSSDEANGEEVSDSSSSDDDDDDDDDVAMTNTATTTATSNSTARPLQRNVVGRHFNRHLNNLKRVPAGTNAEAHLSELKDRRSAKESFAAAMEFPKGQIEARCQNLTLDGRPVEVMEYPTKEQSSNILNALKKFDPDFDENLTSMSQLNKMPLIQQFLSCPQHCHRTDYSLEFRLCGVENCFLCKRLGRSVRAPNVVVDGTNLREEILRFNSLPIPDPLDADHFLMPAKARDHIESEKLSFDDMKEFIPTAKLSKDGEDLQRRRLKDKKVTWHASKVRATAKCTACGASRCIYSTKMIGKAGGPTQEDLEILERAIESKGYLCGDKMSAHDGGRLFYSRRAIRCGEQIEAHYYDPKTGGRGGRLLTSGASVMCAICYVTDDIVPKEEIRRERDVGGKIPLPMCRGCFESGVKPPCSVGGRTNVKHATAQKKQQKKRRQMHQTARAPRRRKT